MKRDGARLILEPAKPKSLLALLKTLKPISEEFPTITDSSPEPIDL